ncbi:putative cytochrome c mitochondrial import factor [Talaromyces proteolyticus]|uniref:Cytochrome c mitochondrial import factor n=1 Tax=Talaromyces proteolyticus TaxID=1131652 RepID=A0AAD4KE32_9EURO|nr:putative cytochrome c mitochondrial import factor [Talaromyces proteolyticus]KAH8689674.1 putative cytochrome c mitochondrial import factor [Talaromyces proteolyticus]
MLVRRLLLANGQARALHGRNQEGVIRRENKRSRLSTATTAPGTSSAPKKRTWLRLTVVTLTAAGIGAYLRTQQDAGNSQLNPAVFAHYRLVSREPVSSTNSIFTLEPSRPADNRETYELAWQMGVWSVMFKQPQLQIGRDYTPLPPRDNNAEGDEIEESLRFLIRRDPHGEVSRYLHNLQVGADVEIRGPQVECEISPDVRDVLFIAGGTGIAPALQAIYILLRHAKPEEKRRIHILWANRKREDCLGGISDTPAGGHAKTSWWTFGRQTASSTSTPEPPAATSQGAIVSELQKLKVRYPEQITVDYFVDEESSFISTKDITAFTDSVQAAAGKQMLIVSGPEGFINYMAGSKMWARGYQLQGSVGGIIKDLDLKDWTIWKL